MWKDREVIKTKTLFKDNSSLGVIISRMQVPYLTESHINMINTVKSRHNKIAIFLGVSESITNKNPLSFDIRRQMIQFHLRPQDIILPIKDNEDNAKWVFTVDMFIESLLNNHETATLYGGRDSFIPYYLKDGGKYSTVELLPEDNDSGTELRNIAATTLPVYSKDVASAIIWLYNQLHN